MAGAVEALKVERVDHGVRSDEDPDVIDMLVRDQIPLTMCPLSNVKLQVFEEMGEHNLKRLLDSGVIVTINSDDPAYFGGYVLENYLAAAVGLGLSRDQLIHLARNSIEASFLSEAEKVAPLADLDSLASA